MELHEAIRRRAHGAELLVRAVEPAVVDRLLDAALRSPTAGNTGGTAWVVLEGPEQTAAYWDATTDEDWRARNPAVRQACSRAPVVLLAYSSPDAYVARYAEADKSDVRPRRRSQRLARPLLDRRRRLRRHGGAARRGRRRPGRLHPGGVPGRGRAGRAVWRCPAGWRLFCAVALGRPDGSDHRSPSLERSRPARASRSSTGVAGKGTTDAGSARPCGVGDLQVVRRRRCADL